MYTQRCAKQMSLFLGDTHPKNLTMLAYINTLALFFEMRSEFKTDEKHHSTGGIFIGYRLIHKASQCR